MKTNKWFLLGLVYVLLAAPNPMVIRHTLEAINPLDFNTLRFTMAALATTPFLIRHRKQFNQANIWPAILAGLSMSVATIGFVLAIKFSQASYVAIITLITPIIFVLYSLRLTKDKITPRAFAGISLAALGALVVVLLPVAIKQGGSFVFYPLATALALVNSFSFPLSTINLRKANEAGIGLLPLASFSLWIIGITQGILLIVVQGGIEADFSFRALSGIIYSGVVVAALARMLSIASYEHIGSAALSVLFYLETLLAIILPVLILGEKLSVEMVLGGALILAGVYLVEHHKIVHPKYRHLVHIPHFLRN